MVLPQQLATINSRWESVTIVSKILWVACCLEHISGINNSEIEVCQVNTEETTESAIANEG